MMLRSSAWWWLSCSWRTSCQEAIQFFNLHTVWTLPVLVVWDCCRLLVPCPVSHFLCLGWTAYLLLSLCFIVRLSVIQPALAWLELKLPTFSVTIVFPTTCMLAHAWLESGEQNTHSLALHSKPVRLPLFFGTDGIATLCPIPAVTVSQAMSTVLSTVRSQALVAAFPFIFAHIILIVAGGEMISRPRRAKGTMQQVTLGRC